MAPRRRSVSLPERLEHQRQEIVRDPLAAVRHHELHDRSVATQPDADDAAFGRELDGIR